MATFNPDEHKNKKAGDSDGVPAGDYLLIMKTFTRRTGKESGKAYLRAVFQVIDGTAKGRDFFDSLSLDLGNSGAMFRLSMLAEQVKSGAFDLDDDAAVREALCRKPFKARVNRRIEGQYINNGIERYLNKEITPTETDIMDAWLIDDAESKQWGGGRGGVDRNGLPDDDVPHAADTDIPF